MTDMNRVAVLIDAENVTSALAEMIFAKASEMGEIVMKEMYGSGAALCSWTEPALRYVIRANITLRQTKGKNTSDIALTIGAMDLLIADIADTVVIVSSDSDFSALALRLRMAGKNVVGMGEVKSNAMWKVACSSFITLDTRPSITVRTDEPDEAPMEESKPQPEPQPAPQPAPQPDPEPVIDPDELRERALEVIRDESDPSGWITVNKLVKILQARYPKMLPNRLGFTKSVALFAGMEGLKMRTENRGGRRGGTNVYLRADVVDVDADIRARIQAMLDEKDGRIPIGSFFPELKLIPGYNELRAKSGKKPQKFLLDTYGDMFDTEYVNGGLWTKPIGAPDTEHPEESIPEVAEPENTEIEAVPETETEEIETEKETASDDQPVEIDDSYARSMQESEYAYGDEIHEPTIAELMEAELIENGWNAALSAEVAQIMTENGPLQAYNAMRKTFGNIDGGNYYNETKAILKRLRQSAKA